LGCRYPATAQPPRHRGRVACHRWLIPQPHDEGFAFDVFDNGEHILGAIHGHQVARLTAFAGFWAKAVFNSSYLAAVTTMVSGHFHHHRCEQISGTENRERWWVQASTSDSGSDWYTRRQGAGGDSTTAITCFELEKGLLFEAAEMAFEKKDAERLKDLNIRDFLNVIHAWVNFDRGD
jgi:hypothetical protein